MDIADVSRPELGLKSDEMRWRSKRDGATAAARKALAAVSRVAVDNGARVPSLQVDSVEHGLSLHRCSNTHPTEVRGIRVLPLEAEQKPRFVWTRCRSRKPAFGRKHVLGSPFELGVSCSWSSNTQI